MIKRFIPIVIAAALVAVGCSDSVTTTTTAVTTVSSADDVVFGSGELPDTIPAEFPLPTGSSIGSTMVVTASGFTEVIIRLSAERGIAVQFYEQGLEQAGFNVDSSADGGDIWEIGFSDSESAGTIEISEPQPGISQALVRWNVP